MKKRIASAMIVFLAFALLPGGAWAEQLLVGGQAVGVEICCEGVLVSGFSEVVTAEGVVSPAEEAGVAVGDLILKIDDSDIRCAEDLIAAAARLGGREGAFLLRRGEKELTLRLRPALSESGQWLLGMWLRDGVSGVGTITFVDPASGLFGALGHGVNDESTGQLVPLREGWISAAEVVGVEPGSPGAPGELCASAAGTEKLGRVERNSAEGVFGHISGAPGGRMLQTGEMRTGEASIMTTLAGHEAREYAVVIDRVYSDGGRTRAQLTVTDGALVSGAGGIVQGMSGSPIIQDGSIVGAVTHVLVTT